jgi:hypothetical protein
MVDRTTFAETLRRGIVAALRAFREQHPSETPYAFALLGGTGVIAVGYAIATEEGLRRAADRYVQRGYRYVLFHSERPATREELATWLRWANPDDGWHIGDLPDYPGIQDELDALVRAGGLGERGRDFEEFCTDVLASLRDLPVWQEQTARGQVIVGFTYGEDPRDFLRTATRANPYPVVRRLWAETWRADELRSRIRPPSG